MSLANPSLIRQVLGVLVERDGPITVDFGELRQHRRVRVDTDPHEERVTITLETEDEDA